MSADLTTARIAHLLPGAGRPKPERRRAFRLAPPWVLALVLCNPWPAAGADSGQSLVQTWAAQEATQPPGLRWSAYVQGRYTRSEDAPDLWSLRRLKLTVWGQPLGWLDYNIQGLYKTNNGSATDNQPYLQNLWLRFQPAGWARFTMGQFIPPFGMERFTSDAEIYTIDRAQVTDHLVPNGQLGSSFARDYGVQWDGQIDDRRLYFAGGLFHGRGANNGLHSPCPLFAARLTYELPSVATWAGHPIRLHVGASAATRRDHDVDLSAQCPGPAAAGLRHFDGRDTRGDLELAADWRQTSVRAEYFRARFDFSEAAQSDFTATGYYVQVAQFLRPKLQAVAKLEKFDPDNRAVSPHDLRWITLGVNYYLKGNRAKVMVDYVFKQERVRSYANNALEIQAQLYL